MNTKIKRNLLRSSLGVALTFASTLVLATGGQWTMSGQSLQNERHQKTESIIGTHNAGQLTPKWETSIVSAGGGDIWTTPAVDSSFVYVPDSKGFLFKINRETGAIVWQKSITAFTGKPGNFSRTTPAIAGDVLILGDQGNRFPFFNGGAGAMMMGVDKNTGDLVWKTEVDQNKYSIITTSATVFGSQVFVGVSSYESAYAAFVPSGLESPAYQPNFRGSLVALDKNTGEIIWKTYTTQPGFSGASVWGSAPSIDVKRGQVFVGTGQNFSVPASVKACAQSAYDENPSDPDAAAEASRSCFDGYPDNHFDSIIAMDIKTGDINWANRVIGYDTWHAACIIPGLDFLCPTPVGTDADFGQAPIFYTIGKGKNKRDLVGAGQKTGIFWAFDAETGENVWNTKVSPGGVAGGIQWGSAYDGDYIYTASANSNKVPHTLPNGDVTTGGLWSALEPETGEIVWQTADPAGAKGGAAVSVANGVLYGCTLASEGPMYAMDTADGSILWSFNSGGSCNAGAAIVDGVVYWGSGYESAFDPSYTTGDVFRAFAIPASIPE
jgi:polyvinyl alcohol dehydrogenase (cytochrome)